VEYHSKYLPFLRILQTYLYIVHVQIEYTIRASKLLHPMNTLLEKQRPTQLLSSWRKCHTASDSARNV